MYGSEIMYNIGININIFHIVHRIQIVRNDTVCAECLNGHVGFLGVPGELGVEEG